MTTTRSTWRIGPTTLKTMQGMIIDRDEAWRADPEWGPIIEDAIRKGIENVDEKTCGRIYGYLRYGPMDEDGRRQPLPGSYETYGHDEKQMAKAWRRYLSSHGLQPMTA
jgi:hypothetical protein